MPENEIIDNASQTSVTTVEANDIDDILGIPGAANVMLAEDDKKPSMFSRNGTDTSFLDNPDDDEEKLDADGKPIIDPSKAAAILDTLTAASTTDTDDDSDESKNQGRPKTDKNALIEFTKKWIEEKKLKPFTNDKGEEEDITKYSVKDFEELFDANLNERDAKTKEQEWKQFFEDLPTEMKALHKYVADGGTDMKGIFSALASVEKTRSLDVTDPNDQEQIARAYLRATNFGTEEDIDEEVSGWKDRDELEAKVTKFKPRLDQMEQQRVAQHVQQQEERQRKQQARAAEYQESIYNVLEPGELNGIKLDKKTQSTLYAGLLQPNYPSLSGKPTNLLGHLLEKYQFVEPNHGLIAEALWLLSDPEGYRGKLKEVTKKETNEITARKLKDAEKDKNGSGSNTDDDEQRRGPAKAEGLKRNNNNFFKRG